MLFKKLFIQINVQEEQVVTAGLAGRHHLGLVHRKERFQRLRSTVLDFWQRCLDW